MATTETAVIDPPEFISFREELALDDIGIAIVDADWGDADLEVFWVRQRLGEIPADRHPPNRVITLKLQAKEQASLPIAEALIRLQQKVGRLEEEGGWIRRDLDDNGKFVSSVGYVVYKASLSGVQGWLMAHRQVANEITLTLSAGPFCYGTKENQAGPFKAGARETIFEIPNINGSAPGLIRVRYKNTGAGDVISGIMGLESRDHPQNATKETTAKLALEGQELTKLGETVNAERSGEKVIRNAAVTPTWTAIASSKIAAGHLSHKGPRRLFARVYVPNSQAATVEVRLEWRTLGSSKFSTNEPATVPVLDNFAIIDLGEVRPELEVLGNRQWECRLSAKGSAPPGITPTIDLQRLWVFPTEQFVKLVEPLQQFTPTGISALDNFTKTENKAVSGQNAEKGGAWSGAGDADDFQGLSSYGYIYRIATGDVNLRTGRFLRCGTGTSKIISVEASFIPFSNQISTTTLRQGLFCRYVDVNNWLMFVFIGINANSAGEWKLIKCVAGVETTLLTGVLVYPLAHWQELNYVSCEADEGGNASVYWNGTKVGSVAGDASLKAGGALQTGGYGIYDCKTDATASTRYYNSFQVITREGEGGICHGGRFLEIRSEGVFRQHSTEEIWARLVPDDGSFLPYAPASGLEERAMRGIIVPSAGDLGALPDSTKEENEIEVFYMPGYHFTSEAE